MEVEAIIFTVLLFAATVRTIVTAIRKTFEYSSNGLDEYERLVFKEDTEEWWTVVLINSLLLSVGVVQLIAPPLDPEVVRAFESADIPWHYDYGTIISLLFAVLINIRIERHGFYYRKRNQINVFGRPRGEGLWTSFKRKLKRRRV